MIFELKFSLCGEFSKHFGFLLHQILREEKFQYSIFEEDGLRLWIQCTQSEGEELEKLIEKLSNLIPQSIFIRDVSSTIIHDSVLPLIHEEFGPMPTFSYCPTCLETPINEHCPICQKRVQDIEKLEEIASLLLGGQSVCVTTESGEHILSSIPNQRVFCIDFSSILEICDLSQKELQALASYEKPILKIKANQEFSHQLQQDEILLSMAHDLQLLKIFTHLKEKGVKFLYSADQAKHHFHLSPMIATPQQALILENDHALILKDFHPSSKLVELFNQYTKKDKAFLATILEENKIKDRNILNFSFFIEGGDKICLYNSQTQWFNEVMDFSLPQSLFELFDLISQDGESGERLIQNYQTAFPNLCEHDHSFALLPSGIMGVWEIAKIVLGMQENPFSLAHQNLAQRGVAIDYSFIQDSLIAQKFDLVKCIRSGMSFKLAGVEEGIIALGYIESFSLLPSKLYLAIRQLVQIDGISLSGDLFSSKMLGDFFYKNNRQTPIYRNITFPLLYS